MAGTRRPEGLLAAGGGRRSGAGIADVPRPTLLLGGGTLGTGHYGKEGTPAPSAMEAEGGGGVGKVKGLSPSRGEGLSRSLGRWVDELRRVPADGVPPFLSGGG